MNNLKTFNDICFFLSKTVKNLNIHPMFDHQPSILTLGIVVPEEDYDLKPLIVHRLKKMMDGIVPINVSTKIITNQNQ